MGPGSKAEVVRNFVLPVLRYKQAATVIEIAEELGLGYHETYGALVGLFRRGLIDRTECAGSVLWISKEAV